MILHPLQKLLRCLKRRLDFYLNSWWLPSTLNVGFFSLNWIAFLWSLGCVPVAWEPPVLDSSFFLSLWVLSTCGVLIAAAHQFGNKWKSCLSLITSLGAVCLLLFGGMNIIGIGFLGDRAYSPDTPINRKYAIEAALEWARLAPLPKSANIIATDIEGSAFTREFRVIFTAPASEIKAWIKASPGIKAVKPTKEEDGNWHYKIVPLGKVLYAGIIVSSNYTKVWIRTFWS